MEIPASMSGMVVGPTACRIRRAVNQSIPVGTAYQDLLLDTAAYQLGGGQFWTSGANCTIFTPGLYQIFVEATYEAAGLGGIIGNMQVLVNGALVIGDDEKSCNTGQTTAMNVMAQRIFAIGDTIKVQVKHSGGVAMNILAQGDHSPDIILTLV
jgi:hypothetical protein